MVWLTAHWHLGLASGHWHIMPGPWPTGTLAWLLAAHWLICSLAHLGLIRSLAHWLVGTLAYLRQFLAFLELFCSSLRLIGSLALICSLAHLLIGSFRPPWLIGSFAH